MKTRGVLLALLLLAGPSPTFAQPAPNVVTEWAAIAQQAIHNAATPRSAGTSEVLQAMVQLAIYDAAIAVEGGYEPYAAALLHQAVADVRAAVATAAYRTARGRVLASQFVMLDQQYANYMAAIADGTAKAAGIQIGEQAATRAGRRY